MNDILKPMDIRTIKRMFEQADSIKCPSENHAMVQFWSFEDGMELSLNNGLYIITEMDSMKDVCSKSWLDEDMKTFWLCYRSCKSGDKFIDLQFIQNLYLTPTNVDYSILVKLNK